ncbi:MAG: ParB/RepB/Spo0J family partition protein [Chloroflexi bacterium]|nr:MAG: ParB/RepB/Spo0J family partition protein [Chloroflexota bacterium]
MSKKRGLGRGLGALIPADVSKDKTQQTGLREVPVLSIQPNPHQPRSVMDDEKLADLAASIREHGLIQPLIVTEKNGRYTLIAGERRWRASQLAKLKVVPVVVKEATPQAMLELAIIENIQRADLNPLEEAYAYQQLMDDFGLTQEDVSQRVGKGRSTIANLVRLIKLPENIQQAVTDGIISGAHARALLPLEDAELQTTAMNQVVNISMSVRQTETLVKLYSLNVIQEIRDAVLLGRLQFAHAQLLAQLPTPEMQKNGVKQVIVRGLSVIETELLIQRLTARKKPASKPQKTLSAEMADLESQFQNSLGTKVNIELSSRGKGGRVVIHYESDEDLNTIYDAIIGE